MGKLAVGLDIAVRFAVIVVAWLLIREFWAEDKGPDADGVPVRLLIPPLGAYLLWNVWFIGRSSRRWKLGVIGDSGFLQVVGVLSFARLLWLLPLADDLWWQHRNRLMILVAASVVCTALALGEGIRMASLQPGSHARIEGTSDQDGRPGRARSG